MLFRQFIVAALGAALLGACRASPPPPPPPPRPPPRPPAQRIVSLSPATTELLFALGAGDRVVGRTRWCQDPPEATRVPSVGDGLDPNVELILARRPDLVVFYHSPTNASAIERLDGLGIASVSLSLDGLADLRRAAGVLAQLTGDSARAHSLVDRFDRDLAEVVQPTRDARPSVLILTWDNPPIVIGGTSFLSEIVGLAGGRNVFDDLERPSATVSIETIAARDPDLVLITGGSSDAAFMKRPEWQTSAAVRHERFAVVAGTEFSHPSFRAARAVAALRAVLSEWTP